jgi:hypothetical protein
MAASEKRAGLMMRPQKGADPLIDALVRWAMNEEWKFL